MTAFALIDKPRGITSFDAALRVRRVVREKRVGHTGTLDPMATGLLIIAIGEATKLIPLFENDDKTYDAELLLGVTTDTGDADGRVTAESLVPALTAARLDEIRAAFSGDILQTPPMYSALKKDGKRLYELARAGKVVERRARPVTVHELSITAQGERRLGLHARVSKGTYIRALATDIGDALGCGAHLTSLRRLAAGFVSLTDAQPLDAFESAPRLFPPIALAERYATLRLDAHQVDEIRHGRTIRCAGIATNPCNSRGSPLVVIDPHNNVIGLANMTPHNELQPRRLLNLK
ncbi:MAG: tRNA pseudouridine(55) synthase TruB [Deltaproteobacteria bacterium]|nr:tRNA pseudouridine(55) synthase TruB [Deltaproteobacteria bacterium]